MTEQANDRRGELDSLGTLVSCEDCTSYIELTRDTNGRLTLTCDCGIQRGLKVKMALPEGWTV